MYMYVMSSMWNSNYKYNEQKSIESVNFCQYRRVHHGHADFSLAQDAVFCDLCDNPAVRFCNPCQTNLCLDCVIRHRDEFESLFHDIVPLKNKVTANVTEC